jgi:hypothetical protein
MDLKKLMVEHSINEFWQKIKLKRYEISCVNYVLRRKELRTAHLPYRKWNGCVAQDRKSKMEGVNPRTKRKSRGEEKGG